MTRVIGLTQVGVRALRTGRARRQALNSSDHVRKQTSVLMGMANRTCRRLPIKSWPAIAWAVRQRQFTRTKALSVTRAPDSSVHD